ncbi:unnamed protein product [Ophioblennius macclurei]
MSFSLSAERDRIQRQVEELEESLYVNDAKLELLSSETDEDSEEEDESADLLEQREKIQREIQNLEDVLGESGLDDSSSDESELGLSLSVDSCLQMNLVYQQVLQDSLDQLEILLTNNIAQQKELISQMSGPIREPPREQTAPSSYQRPITMYLGRFLKPYFKDKLTGLGPPANQETRERSSRTTVCLDNNRMKVKRWESWQKTLLFHSVSKDQLKRLIQPKLSRMEYLSQKLSAAEETDKEQLREQIDSLEKEIDLLRGKKEEELVGGRHDEHDWEKISNIDFEGTREASDLRCFWQNFLHPSITKSTWSREEVQRLKEISRGQQAQHWEEIAEELGTGRTAFMCLQTFQKHISDTLKRSSWTPDEDDHLRQLVDQMRIGNFIPYTQMSYYMEGRQPSQLVYRWNQVLDPTIKKGLWTEEEDQLLLQAVNRHGEKNWWKIRLEVPGRTYNSCRDRYMDCLKAGIKRGPFNEKEIRLLVKLVKKHGVGRWAKIAAEIPHRIDAQCLRTWKVVESNSKAQVLKNVKLGADAPRKKIRRKLKKESSEEEDEEEVPYMDSDDEKTPVMLQQQTVEVEEETQMEIQKAMQVVVKEEVEEEYCIPPLQKWLPSHPIKSSVLKFRPVTLPPSDTTSDTPPVRYTILTKSGITVVVGPPPRELPAAARHCSDLMMVTKEDIWVHLTRLAHRPGGWKRNGRCHTRLELMLMAAVTPFMGDLLIQTRTKLSDCIRERVEKKPLPSSAVFRLLLQSLNVDAKGCKMTIQQMRTPPEKPKPNPPSRKRKCKTVKDLIRSGTEKWREQKQLLLKQLQEQQRQQPRHLLLLPCTSPTPPQVLLQSPQGVPQITMVCHPGLPVGGAASIAPACHPSPPVGGVISIAPSSHPGPPVGGTASMAPPSHPGLPVGGTVSVAPPFHSAPQGLEFQNASSTPTNEEAAPGSTHQPPRESRQQEPQEEEVQEISYGTQDEAEIVRNHLISNTKPHMAPPQPLHPAPASPASTHSLLPDSTSPCYTVHLDHGYTSMTEGARRGWKRRRKEVQLISEPEVSQSDTSPVQEGKRVRKLSEKARALQEVIRVKMDAKKKRLSRTPRAKRSVPQLEALRSEAPPLSGFQSNQSTWVMVQVTPSAPQNLPVVLVPATFAPLPHPVALPNLPHTVPFKPSSVNQPLPRPPVSSPLLVFPQRCPSKLFSPYKGGGGAHPASLRPIRAVEPQFDISLMSLEPGEAVQDWLSGQAGVPAGTGPKLPYLPPFVSNLSMLSALLQVRRSLIRNSLQLLDPDSGPQNLQSESDTESQNFKTRPQPLNTADPLSRTPADLPDSTWDLAPAQPGHCDDPDSPQQKELEETEQKLAAVRHLVSERFSSNPAYQLLKARFLSCFTLPALLATVQPIAKEAKVQEEQGEETDFSGIAEGGSHIEQGSQLLCDVTGAPANHFPGMAESTSNGIGSKRTCRYRKSTEK